MSVNPRIVPDVLAFDAKMHESLRLGFEYMERDRTVVIPRPAPYAVRGVRITELPLVAEPLDAGPPLTTDRVCSHEVREVGARYGDIAVMWQFAYCDHQHLLYTTEPVEVSLESPR